MNFQRRVSKIFFKYVFKSFFTALFCCLGGFITLFIVIQLFDVLPDFLSNKINLKYMLEYFLLSTPKQLLFAVLPISVLLSASFMAIGMTMKHEITALRSAGISLFWYFLPVWIIGLFLSIGTLVLNYYPLASAWMVQGQEIITLLDHPELLEKRDSQTSHVTFNNNRDSSRQWIFGAYRKKGLKEKVFVRQYYEQENKPTVIEWELTSSAADYNEEKGCWIFYDKELVDITLTKNVSEAMLVRWQEIGLNKREVQGRQILENGDILYFFADKSVKQDNGYFLKNVVIEKYNKENQRLFSKEQAYLKLPEIPSSNKMLCSFTTQMGFEANYQAWADSIISVNYLASLIVFKDFMRVQCNTAQQIQKFEIIASYSHPMSCLLKYYLISNLDEEINLLHQEKVGLWTPCLTYKNLGKNSVWIYQKGLQWNNGKIKPPYEIISGEVPLFLARAYRNERIFEESPDRILNSTAQKDELCIEELRNIVRRVRSLSPELKKEYWITIWNRSFSSFMPLIAVFLGISLSLIKERTNPVSGFVKAAIVMLSFYAVDQFFVLMGSNGWLPLPEIVIGGAATVSYFIFSVVMMWRKQ